MSTAYETALARVRGGASARVEARALVEQMSTEEKIHCLDGGVPTWEGLRDIGSGGYHHRPFRACYVPRLGIPGFHFSDGPRGVVVGAGTAFPVSMARGASFDTDLEERIGDAIGRELRVVGADLYGGVCVNLLRHPAWGRAQETYGEDPHHVGELGAALTRGVQRHVMATVKHFALNSMENARFTVDVTCDEKALHEAYLPHFRRIVSEGVAAVMSAYNSVNGQWAGESTELLSDILRGEWGFDGMVISDWIFGLRDGVKSVRAGLDVEMPYRMIRHAPVTDAVGNGELAIEEVERAVINTVSTMLRFGVGSLPRNPESVMLAPEHLSLAREAAGKSMVLLKNDTVGSSEVLPLGPNTGRVAVLGRLADMRNLGDGGSSDVMSPYAVTPFAGISRRFGSDNVVHHDGSDVAKAADIAAAADVAVVVVGYTKEDEGEFIGDGSENAHLRSLFPSGDDPQLVEVYKEYVRENHWPVDAEHNMSDRSNPRRARPNDKGDVSFARGGDRVSLRLPDADVELIREVAARQARTIVVVVCGSAVVMEEWRHEVPAVLFAWYSGMEGGDALADVLTGDVNPSGHLPFAIPTEESHLPFFDKDAAAITYDMWHGQWKLDRDGNGAAYPFGFGLGYTTFGLGEPTVAAGGSHVDVGVTNTGSVPGECVVQVYGSPVRARDDEPRRRLVGFTKVHVEAGASVTARVIVNRAALETRDTVAHRMVLVPGEYRLEAALFAGDPAATSATVRLA
ncbi:MAG: family 3 glycosyl hydrolase [Actinobacteria bacterium]|nr:family 3 glycosyl hydrolase [Actinomycetota bacterium]